MPASFGDFASGAVGGAVAGSAFGPVGTAVGGIIGGASSLFGESAASRRKHSYDDVLRVIGQLREENQLNRRRTLNEGIQRLSRFGSAVIGGARSGAAQRDAARGIKDTEASVLPAEAKATSAVTRMLGGFVTNTNAHFDSIDQNLASQKLSAAVSYAGAPLEPSVGDTLLTVGKGIGDWMNNKSYIGILQGALGNKGNGGGTTPNFSGLPWRP
jgi:hypothetical protein